MKIRIRGNSVRFRLTRSEVRTLCEKGRIEEKTSFNEAVFVYAVSVSNRPGNLSALFKECSIELQVPNEIVQDWNFNDRVGFYHDQKLINGESLALTLEKDFECMDNTSEDQSDHYPNPRAQ